MTIRVELIKGPFDGQIIENDRADYCPDLISLIDDERRLIHTYLFNRTKCAANKEVTWVFEFYKSQSSNQ